MTEISDAKVHSLAYNCCQVGSCGGKKKLIYAIQFAACHVRFPSAMQQLHINNAPQELQSLTSECVLVMPDGLDLQTFAAGQHCAMLAWCHRKLNAIQWLITDRGIDRAHRLDLQL